MAAQPESPTYDPAVYQWEITDPVQGGTGGVANTPLLNLSNRTAWLKQRVDILTAAIALLAPIDSPNFTGSATAPNVADGNDTTLIANTHFVQRRHHGIASINVAGTSSHTCSQAEWGVGIIFLFGTPLAGAYNLIMPAAPGQWVIYNGMSSGTPMVVRTVGGFTVSIVQGAAALIWCDGTNIYRGDNQLTLTGEVKTADLATTGVGAGAYNKANLSIGVDGRITGASNGVVTFADVVGGLGFTPVQQGGGVAQGNNKVYIGWDGNHLRASVDVTDQGRFAMINEFLVQSTGLDIFRMDFPSKSTASGNMFLQMFGGGANTVGSGNPESTLVTMPWTFPNAILGAIGCYLGTTPPVNSPLAVYPYSLSQVQLTVSSNSPALLGCVVLAFGF
jgi:hypothetical protein